MTEGNQTLIPGFQHFDAFGVRLTDLASGAAEYHWRGQESSETAEYDAGTHPAGNGRYGVSLIYMQTRDYDPETGRFLAPDALYVSSLTTQGMNRYIYCNNDPVNYSDPMGFDSDPMWYLGTLIILIGTAIIGLGIFMFAFSSAPITLMALLVDLLTGFAFKFFGVGLLFPPNSSERDACFTTAGVLSALSRLTKVLEPLGKNMADFLKKTLTELGKILQGFVILVEPESRRRIKILWLDRVHYA